MANLGECVAITAEEGADGKFKGEWVSELDGRCAMRVVINGHRGSFAVKTEAGLSGSLLRLIGSRAAAEQRLAADGGADCLKARAKKLKKKNQKYANETSESEELLYPSAMSDEPILWAISLRQLKHLRDVFHAHGAFEPREQKRRVGEVMRLYDLHRCAFAVY